MELEPFIKLIKDKCGMFIDAPKRTWLSAAIQTRMSHTGIECHNRYLNTLLQDHEETSSLVDLITINETYFFRERQHHDLFTDRLIPELQGKEEKQGNKIKVLSAGCATGEEPYSLAISLVEKYGLGILNSVSVMGFDIDRKVIAKARRGIYGRHSFRGVEPSIREKYFTQLPGNQYELIDSIKKNLEFYELNLLSPSYPDDFRGVDVIFYRNVSIYFEPETLKIIFSKLADILNEDGYIFLSSTETYAHNVGILFLEEREGIFLYRKKPDQSIDDRREQVSKPRQSLRRKTKKPVRQPRRKFQRPPAQPSPPPIKKPVVEKRKDSCFLFDEALISAKNKHYDNALKAINTLIAQEPSFTKAYNLKASILINLQRMDEAKTACLDALQLKEWDLECLLLLGMIAKIEGNDEEGVKRLKEVLYMQPSCWLAHLYLGDIYNSQGEREGARQKYAAAMRLLKKNGVDDNGLSFFPISFQAEQLIHLCEHNLDKL